MQIAATLACQVISWHFNPEENQATGQAVFPTKGRDGNQVFAPIDLGGYGQICQKIEEGSTYVLEGTLEPVGKEMRFVVKSAAPTCDPCPIFSSVSLTGGLGADPETKHFESGTQVTDVRLTCSTFKKDVPLWMSVKFWGKTAEIASQYLNKGDRIAVSGYLTAESWNDKASGESRSKIVVTANQLELPRRPQEVQSSSGTGAKFRTSNDEDF